MYEQRQAGRKVHGRENNWMPFSHFPWQWQLQTYWTLNPPLTTLSPASPSPQSQWHWRLRRRARWGKMRCFHRFFVTPCGVIVVYFGTPLACRYVYGLINKLKCCRWLPQWWSGRRWQPSFFWWFCTWWWEQQSSDPWSSPMRGKQVKER